MAVTIPPDQLAQQRWIIDRQHLTPRRLDIQREVGWVGTDGVEDGREGLGLRQVGGQSRPFRVAKARAVEQRLMLFPPSEI